MQSSLFEVVVQVPLIIVVPSHSGVSFDDDFVHRGAQSVKAAIDATRSEISLKSCREANLHQPWERGEVCE